VAGTTAAATPTRPSCTAPTPNGPTKIDGKTVIRRLAPAELTACQPLFANAKKIRALLAELKDLILEIIDTALPPARATIGLVGRFRPTPLRHRLPRSRFRPCTAWIDD
jgi:hypothetical protein